MSTVILPPISRNTRFFKPIFVSNGGSKNMATWSTQLYSAYSARLCALSDMTTLLFRPDFFGPVGAVYSITNLTNLNFLCHNIWFYIDDISGHTKQEHHLTSLLKPIDKSFVKNPAFLNMPITHALVKITVWTCWR